ncbi:MAG: hypothetical protein HY231_23345 [Acidobacteria bacterium]|nr:hypothetical protein [Acidobacteriota bacterium]
MRTKALLGLWALFFLLVAFGIHGSSTGVTAGWWSPEKPYTGYLLWNPPPQNTDATNPQLDFRSDLLMAHARWIRWDELMTSTSLSLSQLSHQPKFPVINTNIGIGQNMLINQHVPVWHLASLSRPATWGYFMFGAQRGLAWYWWFQPFSCFTVLCLLLEILLQGKPELAAFGAFWYGGSAYLVCWSNWPAYLTFFLALSCLSAYHILQTEKRSTLIVWAILLGLSIPGFVMILYPPWQVSLGYLFLLVFVGLFIRDKLHHSFRSLYRYRLLALLGALTLAGLIITAYLHTCWPDLKIMAATVYPGKRVSLGGDYSFALLFEGMYNLKTIYQTPLGLINQTESASFYYLFPAVMLAMALSRKFFLRLGVLGWLLAFYLIVLLVFLFVGLPPVLAKLTFLSYVPPYRADPAIGLTSIFLCMLALARAEKPLGEARSKWEGWMPWVVSGLMVLLFVWHGLAFRKLTGTFLSPLAVGLAAVLAGVVSYGLLRGRRAIFCGVLGVVIVATTALFNPLATNLDHLYDSELAQQILYFNKRSPERPLWLCYGGVNTGMLVTVLGGRSLAGQHWPPQLSLWHKFDPFKLYESAYNRYALVQLDYAERNQGIQFSNPQEDTVTVSVSPHAPLLKAMGARYVLALGEAQGKIKTDELTLLYAAASGNFSIYEIQP